jgi:hypothetical protein
MTSILKANAQNSLDALADGRHAIDHVSGIWRGIFDGIEQPAR